jgi:uncharacterized protein (DUF4415 family)
MKVRYVVGDPQVHDLDSGRVVVSQTDWERVDALGDSEISYDDIPDLGPEFWAQAQVIDHGRKKPITIRVDQDVLDWFKKRGGRYQVLMNQVLRNYMEGQKKNVHGK